MDGYNAAVNDDKRIATVPDGPLSQKSLSKAIDDRITAQLSSGACVAAEPISTSCPPVAQVFGSRPALAKRRG